MTTNDNNRLGKKILSVSILLLAFWILVDNESISTASQNNNNNNNNKRIHHLAVWTALHRHPPCLRIYRALLELNLMLWGLAASLYLWKYTVGENMVGYLLFQPADHDFTKDTDIYFTESNNNNNNNDSIIVVDDDDDHDNEPNYTATNTNGINSNFEHIIPPSPETILHAALDFLILILVTLFLFTISSAEGGRYVDGMESLHTFRWVAQIAAPIFPLVLFLIFCIAVVVPLDKRRSQWQILSYTIGAPLYNVTFRDGFIGDILTSSVRPLQDIAFTVFYLFSGLQGWWSQSYDLDAADLPLESNWMLHTMILPMCMMSPLWYRFCQNLRQTYDSKSRWPYLGNALKYFIAAEVGVFGVYMQTRRQSSLWLMAFVLATLYQIWWDVFMDWNLLEVVQLRKTRIYSVSWMYWSIFGINIVLRFCWTLSFLPPHYLNRAGVLSETFDGDITMYINPIIASAEIVRRIMWGWIRVENEAINDDNKESSESSNLEEFKSMAMNDTFLDDDDGTLSSSSSSTPFSKGLWTPRKMYDMTEIQILGELCIYVTIFTGLGLLAAAHRETQ
ncbi:hypothetical protein FRACYDRAFT_189574 [Fragilariopsis cylindrus CCMP1102]|uniref:EXS domain-containing protein n=1 Tax=Fragilariopsis cylindrus CCMP1102 TaxID=635003 RepID=A0A1E7F7E5_9STRA|nr:hypothetical protein FRACYDRAFT_189574 [Fragilariopsis cylindrus CCMP1102]|eukprot:OEU14024.1 hypothetical protein FRACYDRAFT_189574 [Fragilariopsis cylindrus CCMP1102]